MVLVLLVHCRVASHHHGGHHRRSQTVSPTIEILAKVFQGKGEECRVLVVSLHAYVDLKYNQKSNSEDDQETQALEPESV